MASKRSPRKKGERGISQGWKARLGRRFSGICAVSAGSALTEPLLDVACVAVEPLGVGANRLEALLERLGERACVLVLEERFDLPGVLLRGQSFERGPNNGAECVTVYVGRSKAKVRPGFSMDPYRSGKVS